MELSRVCGRGLSYCVRPPEAWRSLSLRVVSQENVHLPVVGGRRGARGFGAGGGAGGGPRCPREHSPTPDSAFRSASSPPFPIVPGSVLSDPDRLGPLTHPFVVASSVLARGVGAPSRRGTPCAVRCQVVSICGGRGGDSPTAAAVKCLHPREALRVARSPLPECPYGTRRSACRGGLSPQPSLICAVASSARAGVGPGQSLAPE